MWLTILLAWSITWIVGTQGVAQVRRDRQVTIGHGPRILSFSDTIPKPHPKLAPSLLAIRWLKADGFADGYHTRINNHSDLVVEHIATDEQLVLLEASMIPKANQGFVLNSDASQVLWVANRTRGWRHSSYANYFIQDIKTGQIQPLIADQTGDIQMAIWNPK
jgi:dipeptidyl-peptidase-4